MSGHNKWSNIQHRKGAQDAKRSKVFTKVIRELMVAAREGGSDPETNAKLKTVIDRAKNANMPKDTMEKAIKKGAGELEGVIYEEAMYEAYAPAGIALMIRVLTDNKNRTAQEVKHTLSKYGGSLASPGSVAFNFERKGLITVPVAEISDIEEFEMLAIDAGAEDFNEDSDPFEIVVAPESVSTVKGNLEEAGYSTKSELAYLPKSTSSVTGPDVVKVLKLINYLEDNDDVQEIFANFDITDEEMEKAMEELG